jgi:hypothetical protein
MSAGTQRTQAQRGMTHKSYFVKLGLDAPSALNDFYPAILTG